MSIASLLFRQKDVKELVKQVESLLDERRKLKDELEDLKLKKRLEQEEIKHMVRLNEERMKQEVEQEKIKLTKKYHEDIAKFKEEQRIQLVESLKEFHTKIENRFNSELENLKETYKAIMARLPNVNLTLEKRLK
jgi:hypothetical protein